MAGLLGPVIDVAGFTPALVIAALATLASVAPLLHAEVLTRAEETA
jgi:hypothetical protein